MLTCRQPLSELRTARRANRHQLVTETSDVVRCETNAKLDGLVGGRGALARKPARRRGAALVEDEFGRRKRDNGEESEELRPGQHRAEVRLMLLAWPVLVVVGMTLYVATIAR